MVRVHLDAKRLPHFGHLNRPTLLWFLFPQTKWNINESFKTWPSFDHEIRSVGTNFKSSVHSVEFLTV